MVTPSLLAVMLNYAQLKEFCNGDIGALAMSCFNEMLSRNCAPVEFEEYLLKLFASTMQLLVKVTTQKGTDNPLQDLVEGYNEKFSEFLDLFVTIHLRRLENNPQFQITDFLMLLFRFTFLQPSSEGFVRCLDICTAFLDILLQRKDVPDGLGVPIER